MACERSALVNVPEDEDIDSSLHKECVNNKSLCGRKDIDCKNACSDSTLSEDHTTKLTVNECVLSTMEGERSALVDAPENEDIDSSFNKMCQQQFSL